MLEWLVGGVPTGDVETLGSEQFGVTKRAIRKDIHHCRHKILPTWFEWSDKRVMAAELLAKLERVYAKAIAKNDLHAAVRAIRQTAELMGLNSPRMIAAERGTLTEQLAELRNARDKPAANGTGSGMPADQANAIRQLYGMPAFSDPAEYAEWLAAQRPGGKNN